MPASPRPELERYLLIAGILLLTLLFMLRVHPPSAFMAFVVGSTVGFFFLGRKFFAGDGKTDQEPTLQHRIEAKLSECRANQDRFRTEAENILKSMATLREDLERSGDAGESERQRVEVTLTDLESEYSIRHTKAVFFTECVEKLERLRDRHRLLASIEKRRRELRRLRQQNHDDEAMMEETRFAIENDSTELETISDLSHSVLDDGRRERTDFLRRKLEELRRALPKI